MVRSRRCSCAPGARLRCKRSGTRSSMRTIARIPGRWGSCRRSPPGRRCCSTVRSRTGSAGPGPPRRASRSQSTFACPRGCPGGWRSSRARTSTWSRCRPRAGRSKSMPSLPWRTWSAPPAPTARRRLRACARSSRRLAIQAEIDELRDAGEVDNARSGGQRLSHYYCCPWSPIFEARRPVTIAGRRLGPGDQFTFDVSAEELAEGGEFKRELLVGDFSPTSEVDYCDPRAD